MDRFYRRFIYLDRFSTTNYHAYSYSHVKEKGRHKMIEESNTEAILSVNVKGKTTEEIREMLDILISPTEDSTNETTNNEVEVEITEFRSTSFSTLTLNDEINMQLEMKTKQQLEEASGSAIEVLQDTVPSNRLQADSSNPTLEVAVKSVDVSGGRNGIRLLVVDDSTLEVNLLGRYLTERGFDVTTCTDGLQAVEMIKQDGTRFDLIVMDITTSSESGVAITTRVRSELKVGTPIVLISASSECRREALQSGADAFFLKSNNFFDLLETIRGVLQGSPKSGSNVVMNEDVRLGNPHQEPGYNLYKMCIFV